MKVLEEKLVAEEINLLLLQKDSKTMLKKSVCPMQLKKQEELKQNKEEEQLIKPKKTKLK